MLKFVAAKQTDKQQTNRQITDWQTNRAKTIYPDLLVEGIKVCFNQKVQNLWKLKYFIPITALTKRFKTFEKLKIEVLQP